MQILLTLHLLGFQPPMSRIYDQPHLPNGGEFYGGAHYEAHSVTVRVDRFTMTSAMIVGFSRN